MKQDRRLTAIMFLFFTLFVINPAVFAQDISYAEDIEYLEDEGDSLWEQERFLDTTGEEFQTEDAQYVGEEEIEAAEAAAKRAGLPTADLAKALEQDKEMLPENIKYGVGTGVMIGGWFALIEGGDARDNVRFVSIGVLVGAGLGFLLGSKALFIPSNPAAAMNYPAGNDLRRNSLFASAESGKSGTSLKSGFSFFPTPNSLNFQWNF